MSMHLSVKAMFYDTSDFLCETWGIILILSCERVLLIILISSWEKNLLRYYVDITMEREIDYESTIANHSPHLTPPPTRPALQFSACKVKYICICIYIYAYICICMYMYIHMIKSCEYRKQKSPQWLNIRIRSCGDNNCLFTFRMCLRTMP